MPQGEDQFVYKVVDGRAQRTKVDIGQRREGKVEILRGLTAADMVVTAGHLKIRDGTAVKLAAAGSDPGNAPPQVAQAAKTDGAAKTARTVKQ